MRAEGESRNSSEKSMLTVVMVDVVGSSKGYVFEKSKRTKQTWKLYSRLLKQYQSEEKLKTYNTWGDGLIASFSSPLDAIIFTKHLFDNTKRDEYSFLQFRIAIHIDNIEIVKNDLTGREDLIGEGVLGVARLEPVIYKWFNFNY
jgi:class 3 adenylate cyclase